MKIIKKYRGIKNKGCVIKYDPSDGDYKLYRYNEYVFNHVDVKNVREQVKLIYS